MAPLLPLATEKPYNSRPGPRGVPGKVSVVNDGPAGPSNAIHGWSRLTISLEAVRPSGISSLCTNVPLFFPCAVPREPEGKAVVFTGRSYGAGLEGLEGEYVHCVATGKKGGSPLPYGQGRKIARITSSLRQVSLLSSLPSLPPEPLPLPLLPLSLPSGSSL